MCSKFQPFASRRAFLLSLMTAASSSPMLGVAAFSSSSPSLSQLPITNSPSLFATQCPSRQRINGAVLAAAAAAKNDDSETESESSSDGEDAEPASAGEDEVSRQLAKARELIEKTKQKMEKKEKESTAAATAEAKDEKENDEDDEVLPFFAVDPSAMEKRREMVTKTKNEESGLITTDGDKMASIADGEKWESRGLYDLFENEIEEDEETLAKEARASRDVARSMMNLKMIMNKDDFDFIFNKKNRWIGEE